MPALLVALVVESLLAGIKPVILITSQLHPNPNCQQSSLATVSVGNFVGKKISLKLSEHSVYSLLPTSQAIFWLFRFLVFSSPISQPAFGFASLTPTPYELCRYLAFSTSSKLKDRLWHSSGPSKFHLFDA
ncbi:hypothetical protein ACFE04_008354 [Oxalis oulophora]